MSLIKGIFIVFEGIDGSGTSTQAEMLNNYFLNNQKRCHLTSEPSNGPVGNMIRQAFKGRLNLSKGENPYYVGGNLFDEQMAYLFAADRHDHLYNDIDGIIKLINQGITVISTRYYFSSYAYHCSSDADFELVTNLNSRFPKPDLVVYLNNTVLVSINRMQNRAFKDEYENEMKLNAVKNNYTRIFDTYDGEVLIIDATDSIDNIHKAIVAKVRELEPR
jgi:dTMP kinase